MYIYAQIDNNNICFAQTTTEYEIESFDMILVSESDLPVIGKRYNNGTWEEVPTEPIPTPDPIPSTKELNYIQYNQVSAQNAYLAKMYESQPVRAVKLVKQDNVYFLNKQLYENGYNLYKFFSIETVRQAVIIGEITAEDFKEITGEDY